MRRLALLRFARNARGVLAGLVLPLATAAAAPRVGVAVLGGEEGMADRLRMFLGKQSDIACLSANAPDWSSVAAAVILPGGSPAGANRLAAWVAGGKGLVVVKPDRMQGDWAAEILGAREGGVFARGARMDLINFYDHPILTDAVRGYETNEGMIAWTLAGSDQVILEGTVREDMVPMAWVRRYHRGRAAAVEPGRLADFQNPLYLQILANAVRWTADAEIPGAIARIQRLFMPKAYPSALAITYPRGPAVCYDTVRGGIDYVWNGDFVDPRPAWITRHGSAQRQFAAATFGPIFYREPLTATFHVGTRQGPADYRFLGYWVQGDGSPEIHGAFGDRTMIEHLTATPEGDGVVRHIHVAAGMEPLWMQIDRQDDARVEVTGAARQEDGSVRCEAGRDADFTVTIRRKDGAAMP